ncbi:MAG TPA: secondary thiamine-phosphate synthase enzyme YjbQ [Candidatus Dormibacteraeota bacterium]|nr:secondary thiamine-phosphate synthase enzyme YjbQ [Candidatus Dormibacteraeota bacterium]
MIVGRRLQLPTSRPTEFVDITARLQEEIAAAGLRNGRLHLQSLHTTLGLAVNENEPLLLEDLAATLERLAPAGVPYRHDDLKRRPQVGPEEPINGHAHCRQLVLLPACTLLVEEGRLVLGRWQSVFAVELDGPRQRQVALQLDGDFGGRRTATHLLVPTPTMAREERVTGAEAASALLHDRRLVELELARQLLVDPEPVQLPMRRLVEAGGKRVRPLLAMLSSRLGPRVDPLQAAALAGAIELIHDATLVHDDYVDEAPTRRGRPTVAAQEGAATAIAVGDYYFAKAVKVIAQLGNPDVTTTIAQAVEAICLAQIDDVRLRGNFPGDHETYLKVVRGKTAALFAAACRAGAQLAGAEESLIARLERFGDLLGVAFQMIDDLLDYSERSGKPLGQDIRQRTVSLPLIYAVEHPDHGGRVRELLAGTPDEEQVREVQRLVIASGALDRVGEEARSLVSTALRELEEAGLDGVRAPLADLARSAIERVH